MTMFRTTLALALCLAATAVCAQAPDRLRGTLTAIDGETLQITTRDGGAVKLRLGQDAKVTAVVAAHLADIKPGSFIGTAARTQADGTLRAVEVHVFPEAMRGSGEGHRAFDLGPKSTMTNGTVGQEVVDATGSTLTVKYRGGEKVIQVPPDVPVVTFEPGDRTLLTPGAHLIVFGVTGSGDDLSTRQLVVGKDGLVPPM